MLEIRKDIFADERNDNLQRDRQGRRSARTCSASHRHLDLFRRPQAAGHAASQDGAQPAPPRAHPPHRHRRGGAHPGVRADHRGADVPHNLNTLLSLINFGPEDEPAGRRQGALEGRAHRRRRGRQRARGVRGHGEGAHRLRAAAGRLRRRGGAEARRAAGQRDYPQNTSPTTTTTTTGSCASATSSAASPPPITSSSSATRCRRSSTRRPRRTARSWCPTTTAASRLYLDAGAVLLARQCAKILDVPSNRLHFIGGTVGGGFGGKVDTDHRADRHPGRHADRHGRSATSSTARRRCSSPRRAAPNASIIKDGVMKDGRIVARQVRGYVDSGAYTRHSRYGVAKARRIFRGPTRSPTSPATSTASTPTARRRPRCAASASPSVDFALEVQMDKLARLIGMDPLEFRFVNAYRDGDMKAHRRERRAALIECMQEAAARANWPVATSSSACRRARTAAEGATADPARRRANRYVAAPRAARGAIRSHQRLPPSLPPRLRLTSRRRGPRPRMARYVSRLFSAQEG